MNLCRYFVFYWPIPYCRFLALLYSSPTWQFQLGSSRITIKSWVILQLLLYSWSLTCLSICTHHQKSIFELCRFGEQSELCRYSRSHQTMKAQTGVKNYLMKYGRAIWISFVRTQWKTPSNYFLITYCQAQELNCFYSISAGTSSISYNSDCRSFIIEPSHCVFCFSRLFSASPINFLFLINKWYF